MPHFYRRSKVDANQREIVDALRRVGVSVLSLAALGDGAPDLLCSFRGRLSLLEVKRTRRALRPSQTRWHAQWDDACRIHVVTNDVEAIAAATAEDGMSGMRCTRCGAVRAE